MATLEEKNYEELRRQNLEQMKRKFEEQFGKMPEVSCGEDDDDDEDDLEEFKVNEKRKPRKYTYKKMRVSLPMRMSLRSRGECSVDYSEADKLLEELENPKLQNGAKKILIRRSMPVISFRHVPVQNLKPVSEITAEDIARICYKSANRVYDPANGTTCHQCRQKTTDFKSICRSPTCNGIRGQFCGFCLLKRYGEDVAKVVLDEKWSCPPCRNICNCSICRKRLGKLPTGILAPIAESQGYSNVKDFLFENEKDLYIYEDNCDSDKENSPLTPSESNLKNLDEKILSSLKKPNSNDDFPGFPSNFRIERKVPFENRKKISEHFDDSDSSDFSGFSAPTDAVLEKTKFHYKSCMKINNASQSNNLILESFAGFTTSDIQKCEMKKSRLESFLKNEIFRSTKEESTSCDSFIDSTDLLSFSASADAKLEKNQFHFKSCLKMNNASPSNDSSLEFTGFKNSDIKKYEMKKHRLESFLKKEIFRLTTDFY